MVCFVAAVMPYAPLSKYIAQSGGKEVLEVWREVKGLCVLLKH